MSVPEKQHIPQFWFYYARHLGYSSTKKKKKKKARHGHLPSWGLQTGLKERLSKNK